MKSLFLVSGGLDSTSGMYRFKHVEYDCLHVNYGQRAYMEQSKFVKLHCRRLGKRLIEVDLKEMGKMFRRNEVFQLHEPIRHRNAVLLPLAIVYASEKGYSSVYVFTVSEECKYESNKPQVLNLMRRLADTLNTRLVFPFLGFSKALVLKVGISHGMNPFETYSCILGHKTHCGKCSQCEARKLAFQEARIPDKTRYLS
ncbi:7-cyano-7-deazaguanine synthase [Metallosphaera tengchongensis]|uniref:7-cyano-7-deazaguanine synthase n=1 Tax=Metallosphaera tengchongensis TaxID=1532350 RepID=A0A6N0NR66_9CREN|nr:7-cyano-7-deazaguanine synthase [Metallosphaera tengchongensis]QKQ99235.1 7-cyano-7-deazaguanine synthase [Metallosphaera tengchongensis]